MKRFNWALMSRGGLWGMMGGVLLLYGTPAVFATTTQSFLVSANIVPGCLIQGLSGGLLGTLSFGSYPGTHNANVNAAFSQASGLTLTCTPGVVLNMTIDGGTNYNGARNLKQSGDATYIPYRLYTDSAHTGASEILVNQSVSLGSSTGGNITLPLYGVAQLNGFSAAGTYTDTLSVTLSW